MQNHLQQSSLDTSHGVRCLLTKEVEVIVTTPACLTGAIHSQGFSPSQRLNPTSTVRLCFAPLPPIGFWPSELFPFDQPWRLSTPTALLLFVATTIDTPTFRRRQPPACCCTAAPELFSGRIADTRGHAHSTSTGRCSLGLSPLRGNSARPQGKPVLRALLLARRTERRNARIMLRAHAPRY